MKCQIQKVAKYVPETGQMENHIKQQMFIKN